jgi:hypothetical protein
MSLARIAHVRLAADGLYWYMDMLAERNYSEVLWFQTRHPCITVAVSRCVTGRQLSVVRG